MARISRRSLFETLSLTTFAWSVSGGADGADRFESGNGEVDRGARKTIIYLCRIFGLEGDWQPNFRFYDEEEQIGNARAALPIRGPTGLLSRPGIEIGRKLVAETLKNTSGDYGAALTGILAHEFSHVYQTKSGYDQKLDALDINASARLVEMHADFLAGWALPQAWWIVRASDLGSAARQFNELGDMRFEAGMHHGSSIQRQTVMAAGYAWGLTNPGDPDAAAERGLAVLKDLFPHWFRST